MLPSVVDQGRHIMRSERSRWANLGRVVRSRLSVHSTTPGLTGPASRRRDLEGTEPLGPVPNLLFLVRCYAAASLPQRKSVPFAHMRWRTPASLRAKATLARFVPRRLATSRAQRLRAETRTVRVSIALAAS